MVSPVVVALVDAATAVMTGPLDDVVVLDSIDPAQAFATRSLTIGGGWDEESGITGTDAVLVATTEVGAGRRTVEEHSVACVAYAGGGDLDLPGYRTAVGEVLAALRQALRRLTDVDGVAARAQLGEQGWLLLRGEEGDGVIVEFTVLVSTLP
jgi:hypothetical protein